MKHGNTLNASLLIIGDKLLQLRYQKKDKLATVGHGIGYDPSVISQIERGKYTSLTLALLAQLATYYGLTLDELLIQAFSGN